MPICITIGEKVVFDSKQTPTMKSTILVKGRRQGYQKDDINLALPTLEVDFTRPYRFADGFFLLFEYRSEGLNVAQAEEESEFAS